MLLAKPCDGEPKVFFVKMVGDYYRYIAENAKGDNLGVLIYEQTIEDFSVATVDGLAESLRKKDLLADAVIGTDKDGSIW